MPDEANKLMMENLSKNLVDQDEYPMTTIIHTRCELLTRSFYVSYLHIL